MTSDCPMRGHVTCNCPGAYCLAIDKAKQLSAIGAMAGYGLSQQEIQEEMKERFGDDH